jgi:uncharacterized protein YecT (DUF1311 family)
MRSALTIAFVLFSSAALGQDCARPTTAPEVNECALLQQQRTEKQLDAAYARLVKSLSRADTDGENFSKRKKSVVAAQRAWIVFRKADCDALYKANEGGSMKTVVFHNCLQRHAERRIADLKEYSE